MDTATLLAEMRRRESELLADRADQQAIIETQQRAIDGIDERLHEVRGMIAMAAECDAPLALAAPQKAKRRNLKALLLDQIKAEPGSAETIHKRLAGIVAPKDINRVLLILIANGSVTVRDGVYHAAEQLEAAAGARDAAE